jgi:SAM-dependent methyltransferase
LISSIVSQTSINRSSSLLEVGCATGFLAVGLFEHVREYVGVDVAAAAIRVARSMHLANCTFDVSDGESLPYPDNRFDAAILYDVVTNFPSFSDVEPIMVELMRVTCRGGRVLIGSIPNEHFREEDQRRAAELANSLGPLSPTNVVPRNRAASRVRRRMRSVDPGIVGYYFRPEDFVSFGTRLNVRTRIETIHPLNPYVRSRFNVVFEL